MQRFASRSRFDVDHDTRLSTLSATIESEIRRMGRTIWTAAILVLITLRVSTAADSNNVLLDFTATWCGPCQQMSSTISKLERQGYSIRKVDVDKEPALASRFNVQSIPCFVLVANGQELDRVTGLTTEQQLRSMLNRLPKSAPAVADKGKAPRQNSGSSFGGLGTGEKLGELDQPERKAPLISFPPMNSAPQKSRDRFADRGEDSTPAIWRGQSPDDSASPPTDGPVDLLQASVRLRVNDGSGVNFGSGTVIESSAGHATILTCGHIFRKTGKDSKVEVDVFGPANSRSRPETINGKVLHFDLDADVGVLTINYPHRLPVVQLAMTNSLLKPKDRAISIGCGGGDKPSREDVMLTALNKYQGPDNIECTGMPQQGRSGGGLFLQGELIGICIAADPKDKCGIYTGMKPVAQLLNKVGLDHLVRTPPAAETAVVQSDAELPVEKNEPQQNAMARGAAAEADELRRALGESTLYGAPGTPLDYEGAEIICIVRSKTPGTASRVVVINQASSRFVADLLHESQEMPDRNTARAEDKTARELPRDVGSIDRAPVRAENGIASKRNPASSVSSNRPIETSLESLPYRRQRGE